MGYANLTITPPGTPFGGGFYAGRIVIDGRHNAVVVAPKAQGENEGLPWKVDWHSVTPGAQSLCDGYANSEAMNDDGHPAARWARRLRISGFDDWYLPSRDELEILYRAFKPGTMDNFTCANRAQAWGVKPDEYNGIDEQGNGCNRASDPVGQAYTQTDPPQTTALLFQAGGGEAFADSWYWSSSEFSSDFSWLQYFGDGQQYDDIKGGLLRVRAVRKVPL